MTLLHSRTSKSIILLYRCSTCSMSRMHITDYYTITMLSSFRWDNIEFPLPFGRVLNPTESFIHSLDEKVISFLST